MRPAMLLSAVVLWLKWEKPFYLFLSPRQWPFFCVQMLQCVDNIPVGFGGGLSQCWWHFDPPPPPHLKLTSRVAFLMYRCLAEEPLCRPSDSCSGSWIINPLTLPPQEPTFAFFFVRSRWSGSLWIRRHQCGNHLHVWIFFSTPTFICTRPVPRSGLTSPLNNRAASFFEMCGEGQWGTSLGWSVVVSVVRRGLGVREILVYRLHVFTFLMVSASFRDCWKSKEMLLFCLVMEKSNPTYQGIQMRKANLFIGWTQANACWVESEMTSLMNLWLGHGKTLVTLSSV